MYNYDREGNEITKEEHMKLWSDPEYRKVGLWANWCTDTIVSTIWLGISFHGSNSIFETYVSDLGVIRTYSTLEEAIAGHKEVVLNFGGSEEEMCDEEGNLRVSE